MWRRMVAGLAVFGAVAVLAPGAHAQDSSLGFNLGYFTLRGSDSRAAGDVLNADLCIDASLACEPLLFEIGDFNGGTFGAEYILGIGDYVEASAGIGFYQRTVPSIYEGWTDIDGTEIEQDLKLRVIPISAVVRFIPTGRASAFQPYVGAGIAAFRWRYTETGEFLDTSDLSIFRATYEAEGTDVGPLILAGVKAPVADNFLIGGEVRWQRAEGDLAEDDFLGDKIDLGGISYSAVLQVRF